MDGAFSPGRAAEAMRLHGWRVILPFLYVFGALMGLAGLIGSWSGLVTRNWLVSLVTQIDPEAVVVKPGTPGVAYAIVASSVLLLAWGLVGIVKGERAERTREALIRRAEASQHVRFVPREDQALSKTA